MKPRDTYSMYKLAKTIPIILGGLTLVLTLSVSVLSVTNKNLIFQGKTKAADGEVKLSLAPSRISLNLNEKSAIGIVLETKEHKVSGVDLKIKYDPEVLEILESSIVNSLYLEKVFVKKVENGVIAFSAVTFTPKAINAVLLSVPFKTTAKASTKMEFIPLTLVLENETAANILEKTENAEISIH